MAEMMNAMVIREHGGPEVLHAESIPMPEPGPGQVRVAVRAVALNHLDVWVRRGGPAFHVDFPHRLGAEIAGEIDAVGPGVSDLEIGARAVVSPGLSCGVCAACLSGRDNFCRHYQILGESTQGGYGDRIVVPRANIAPYPGDLPFEEAAASLLTFVTAWQMLVGRAQIVPGEWVLIHGAASGVGVAAIQIAKLFGARVIATASTADKLALATSLGAEHAINYAEADFLAETKRITGKVGVDCVFEHVGGETFEKSIKAVRWGGRIVTCGATSGFCPAIDLRHVFFRQISILGSTMGSKGDMLTVLDHVAKKRLRPVVDSVLPLSEAARAHQRIEARDVRGKIVLRP